MIGILAYWLSRVALIAAAYVVMRVYFDDDVQAYRKRYKKNIRR